MEVGADYLSHINIVKDMFTNKDGSLRNTTEEFEAVYSKMQESDVNLSNAKEFLQSLSKEELKAIKEYKGFADDIDPKKFTDEGAYNALVHRYEIYDFDNDGYAMVGEARSSTLVPQNMEPEAKKAFVESFKDASTHKEKSAMIFMMTTIDSKMINKHLAQKFNSMTPQELAEFQALANFDVRQFILDYIDYKPKTITKEDVLDHIEELIKHNQGSEGTAFRQAMAKFSNNFEKNYNEAKEQTKLSATTDEILHAVEKNT